MSEKFQETKPLNAEISRPEQEEEAENEKWLHVGNSGLSISYRMEKDGPHCFLHFMPEGDTEGKEGAELKNAAVFGYAFSYLLQWLEGPDREKELPDIPHMIMGYTNDRMLGFMKNIFGEALKKGEGAYDPDMQYIELDLDAVRGNAGLRERLDALRARAESQGYVMTD